MEAELTDESTLRDRAVRQLKRKREFRSHLFIYIAVNALLWAIWALEGEHGDETIPWPAWVTVFWGLGVAIQAWHIYGQRPISETEIEEEMSRLRR